MDKKNEGFCGLFVTGIWITLAGSLLPKAKGKFMKNYQKLLLAVLTLFVWAPSCKKSDVSKKEISLYETDFSNDDGNWSIVTSGNYPASIRDGYYHMANNSSQGIHFYWTRALFSGITHTTAIEASVKVFPVGGSDYGTGGLMWNERQQNNTQFFFVISSSGEFAIYGYPNADETLVKYKDWALHSKIRKDQFNKLRVELRQETLYFFINDAEVYKMTAVNDRSLDLSGFGVVSGSSMQVDYFKAVERP